MVPCELPYGSGFQLPNVSHYLCHEQTCSWQIGKTALKQDGPAAIALLVLSVPLAFTNLEKVIRSNFDIICENRVIFAMRESFMFVEQLKDI